MDRGDASSGGVRVVSPDIKPPNPPWEALGCIEPPSGYLSFFFSDPLSRYPVRGVTRSVGRKYDNKSDPNIETSTYGLFSTCEQSMRVGVVTRGRPYLFFVTTANGGRALAGYYRIGWWTRGPLIAAYQSDGALRPDIMLAAAEVRFIYPAIDLVNLAREVGDSSLERWFRLYKTVDPAKTEKLLSVLRARPDRTSDFVDEVHRLERLNLRYTGFRYPGWGRVDGFDWEVARTWLDAAGGEPSGPPPPYVNKKAIKYWRCLQCEKRVDNLAPLKQCRWCGAFGTLIGVNED
jgi:hypothetical protein